MTCLSLQVRNLEEQQRALLVPSSGFHGDLGFSGGPAFGVDGVYWLLSFGDVPVSVERVGMRIWPWEDQWSFGCVEPT